MKIASWNIQRLTAAPQTVADEICQEPSPAVLAFQEFPFGNKGTQLRRILEAKGYTAYGPQNSLKSFGCYVFVRGLARQSPCPLVSDDEKYWIEVEFDGVGISAVHILLHTYRSRREDFWNSLIRWAESRTKEQHIIIGDLNTTRHGIDEVHKSVPGDHFLRKMEDLGWKEAWRSVHTAAPEYTWYSRANNGFRLDQAWLSPPTYERLLSTQINHEVRTDKKCSDHSMLIVELKNKNLF